MKYVKLFEDFKENSDTLRLTEKCIELFDVVIEWSKVHDVQVTYEDKTDVRKVKAEIKHFNVGWWWLSQAIAGKKDTLYSMHSDFQKMDGIIIPGLFISSQGFFNIKIITRMASKFGTIYINVNLGHNGENLVVGVGSGHPETKQLEASLEKYINEHFDPEYKIDGMSLNDYLHKKRGDISGKKFGF
jgi:hypothetical protein